MNPNERRTVKHRHISKMPLVIAFTFIVIAVVISIVIATAHNNNDSNTVTKTIDTTGYFDTDITAISTVPSYIAASYTQQPIWSKKATTRRTLDPDMLLLDASRIPAKTQSSYNAYVELADNKTLGSSNQNPLELNGSAISVSTIKLTYNHQHNGSYYIICRDNEKPTEYAENIRFDFIAEGVCYITGLRANTRYDIHIFELSHNEINLATDSSIVIATENPQVIQKFPYEPGDTNYFTYAELSSITGGLAANYIQDLVSDPVTSTGIMRDEYGDYCVSMGSWYGSRGDRFLIELENGVQFTVKICDSKGLADDGAGRYSNFGDDGKNIITFITGDYLPASVVLTGNYGSFEWSGLIFDNIKSIDKINYGPTCQY